MLRTVRHLLEMIRFSHTLFALPFALAAAVMAWQHRGRVRPGEPFAAAELLGIVLCMLFARSAAMAFNRLADRHLDARNPRTAGRHLPAGILGVRTVAVFAAVSSVAFVLSTLLFLPNPWPLRLSLPVLAFLLAYSATKRFTWLSHAWLGAALMLAPVAAWIAVLGLVDLAAPLVLGGAVLLWVTGFDIIYACQDYQFDVQAGLCSVPARFGVPAALRIAAACHLGMVGLLAALPVAYPPLGWIYYCGVAAIGLLLAAEHALVRPDDLRRVNLAFFHVNAVISVGLLAVTALDLWLAG